MSAVQIALVGDPTVGVKAHAAIPTALGLSAAALQTTVVVTWVFTPKLNHDAESQLRSFHGIWCVPGSPYASMDGALNGIRFAREQATPFLGTCGGFQHALIEYCRNVLGLAGADHAESNPDGEFPLITPLPCPLRETESRISLDAQSRARAIYGRAEITETFNCGYGLSADHARLFAGDGLRITGADEKRAARIVELSDHPFFIATLFQPERSAFQNTVHPVITAFLQAACAQ